MSELTTRMTCPECGHSHDAAMPENACVMEYECPACKAMLKPKQGDCCVFCSYGTVPCPPVQEQWENGQLGVCCSGD
ncbi:MAG: hypothetical protein C0605_06165 [Hyphomicrobiales bacterium]|nr:MAG: hypothetical protein C0605_06165 [Hyphomicrobiales bacterium]